MGITLRTALLSWLVTIATVLIFVIAIIPMQKRTFLENLESKARGLAASLHNVAAGAAVKPAGRQGRIHVFLATSKIHREFKLGKAQDEILRLAVEGVKRARTLVEDVEFSPEDASRTEPEFLAQVAKAEGAAKKNTIMSARLRNIATAPRAEKEYEEIDAGSS